MAKHPVTRKTYFFVEKCLTFGSSISCSHFQKISDAIAHIVKIKTGKENVNYLDDFLFVALLCRLCNQQIDLFLEICKEIRFPVSMEKTFWGSTVLVFLGLMLDTENQVVCIPADKISKAMEMIDYFIDCRNKKVTVLQVQSLCGFLNFLCRCVMPGRVFTTRLYSLIAGSDKLKQHHHVRVKEENRLELMVWKVFLSRPEVFCIPFAECGVILASEVNMFSDSSGKISFGAICNDSWMYGKWDKVLFLERFEPSIEYLELYALTAGVLTWLERFRNRKIFLFCDNLSVVHMINNTSAKCKKLHGAPEIGSTRNNEV